MLCFKCLQKLHSNNSIQHGLHVECFKQSFNLSEVQEFQDISLRSGGSSDPGVPGDPQSQPHLLKFVASFFQGKFKKYSANLDGNHYILKVQEQDYPELPATEYLSNQLAVELGLRVPIFSFILLEGKIETFVTKNFISKNNIENLIHIYHFINEKQSYSCETLLDIIKDKTQRLDDIKQFIMMCLFDSFIGNHDRHGRNLALIQHPHRMKLAPMYDNPSYLGIELDSLLLAHHEPSGRIATLDAENPVMDDYVKEFNRLGYGEYVTEFYSRINLDRIETLISQSFISLLRKQAIKNLISRRYEAMRDAITQSC